MCGPFSKCKFILLFTSWPCSVPNRCHSYSWEAYALCIVWECEYAERKQRIGNYFEYLDPCSGHIKKWFHTAE